LWKDALKLAYNTFFEGKKAVIAGSVWQERSDITFQVTSGISLIDVISENSSSSSQGTGFGIYSGCIRLGSVTA
jgi:hypothetical protein